MIKIKSKITNEIITISSETNSKEAINDVVCYLIDNEWQTDTYNWEIIEDNDNIYDFTKYEEDI